jgi:predicted permease
MLSTVMRRLAARLRRDRLDDELAEEMRHHVELRRQALVDDGMDPAEADAAARRLFGNVTALREESRDMWGFPAVESIVQDLAYAVRLLRRSPTFTAVAVASLAIGIGAAAAVFALADAALFKTLPVRAPGELVLFRWTSGPRAPFQSLSGYSRPAESGMSSTSFPHDAFARARDAVADRADVFGFADLDRVNVAVDGRPDVAHGLAVGGTYFAALGLTPIAGRPILPSDDRPDAPPVAVVSASFARQQFGTPDAAPGRPLLVNGREFAIVGVVADAMGGVLQVGVRPAIAVPLAAYGALFGDDIANPNFWWVLAMARLKPGVQAGDIEPVFETVLRQTVAAARPELGASDLPSVAAEAGSRGQTEERAGMVEPLKTMAIAVGIILLVACANVAGLLLARGRARAREVAVRVAIGAPRRRVVRQLLTEAAVIAALGGVAGLLVARWASGALAVALSNGTPGATPLDVSLDWRAAAFAAGVATLATMGFGLLPSWRTSGVGLAAGLREGQRATSGVRQRPALGTALVIAQVALSMLLVSGAGVLAWSVRNLLSVDPGFDPRNLLVFRVTAEQNGYDPPRIRQTLDAMLERVRRLPGVRGASLSSHMLLSNSSAIGLASRTDEPRPKPGDALQDWARTHRAWRLIVDDTFLSTAGIRLLRGRGFTPADTETSPRVAVINAALANQLYGTADVVGRQVSLGLRPGDPPIAIVGVAADAKYTSLRAEAPPTAYLPLAQNPMRSAAIMVRTEQDPRHLASTVAAAVREVDPTVPLVDMRTQLEQIDRSVTRERIFAALATWLAVIALLLSAIGIYGLMAYSVARRTPEIGVRMALGAEAGEVRGMILRQSAVLGVIGVLMGAPAALYGTRVLESLVFGIGSGDARAIAGAAAVMLATVIVAAYVPARRAASVDPIVALRAE